MLGRDVNINYYIRIYYFDFCFLVIIFFKCGLFISIVSIFRVIKIKVIIIIGSYKILIVKIYIVGY